MYGYQLVRLFIKSIFFEISQFQGLFPVYFAGMFFVVGFMEFILKKPS